MSKNTVVDAEDVIAVIKQFYLLNEADEATTDIILAIGSELLNVSADRMLELLDEAN